MTYFHRWAWPAYRQRLLRSKLPILVGPFRSELGFEALYWLPFLAALRDAGVKAERMIPISRGGAAAWYGTPTGLELYAMRTPQEIRIENKIQARKTGLQKQVRVTAFDRAILADAAQTLGLKHYHVLHPVWMYRTLAPYWEGWRGLDWLVQRTKYDVLPPPPLPDVLTLPDQFVAVRFYFRSTFPVHDVTVKCATAIVQQLAAQRPVILLNSDTHADEHQDLDIATGAIPNVTRLKDLIPLTDETNLLVQSAVLARAVGFVGTYGGVAQLALRFGRPTVSLYLQWHGTALAHKHLADAMSVRSGIPFTVQAIKDMPMIRSVLPDLQVQ